MIPKSIDEISSADLDALIAEGRSEDRTIEYKLTLPNNADGEKIPRLLKPVCSFANTDGGDLIFGVRENAGIPEQIDGMAIQNFDQTKLAIEHMIQNGIEPQIRGVHIKEVRLPNENHVLVLRVPKSWISPHRVKSNSKFYARNSLGSYELDVPQLRQAVLVGDSLEKRLRDFRADLLAVFLM